MNCDHGSYDDEYNASAPGRIWNTTALRLSDVNAVEDREELALLVPRR
jgi:hypothetical protein